MRIVSSVVLTSLVALGIGAGGTATNEGRSRTATQPSAVLLGIEWGKSKTLVRVDPLSLRRVDERTVSLDPDVGEATFSPDRSRVAFGSFNPSAIKIVDPGKMEVVGEIDVPFANVRAWPTPRRLLAVSSSGDTRSVVVVVDPVAMRVVIRVTLGGEPVADAPTSDGLALVVGPRGKIGPAKLVLFDAEGKMRTAPLPRIRAGWFWQSKGGDPVGSRSQPGLAVDSQAGHAYVIAAGDRVADVDLATLRVVYHDIEAHPSLFTRLRDWLEPRAEAKLLIGPARQAAWLGDGMIATWGADAVKTGPRSEIESVSGLKLIDVRSWSLQMLDGDSEAVSPVADPVLGLSTFTQADATQTLRSWSRDGSRLFEQSVARASYVRLVGPYVYIFPPGSETAIVLDRDTGAVLARPSSPFLTPLAALPA